MEANIINRPCGHARKKISRGGNLPVMDYFVKHNVYEFMKRLLMIGTAIFLCLALPGCAHSEPEMAGPPIDDIEAISIASAAAEKGGWEVLDVRDPKRVKSEWRVFVMRKEKGAVGASPVVVMISADGKSTRLVYPNVPNVGDDLKKSKPIRRMSPQ